MKILNTLALAGTLIAANGALVSCVQDDYDLGDVNTLAKLKVNELTLPVQIDPIELKSVIEIDENSKIQIVDGQYVVLEKGTFSSSPIEITAFSMAAPRIESTQKPSLLPVAIMLLAEQMAHY